MARTTFRGLIGGVALVAAIGCGGSGGGHNVKATVTGAVGPDGSPATFHAGSLPAPQGSLVATVSSSSNAINGGSVSVSVDGGSRKIVTIYVSVPGSDGYWAIPVPAGTSVADVLLTLARLLPDAVTIVFEVVDAAGNVSAPVTLVIAVTHVGTGDLQISVSWDVDNDIDLHVVDPNGFEIYYASDTSPEGGNLDLDSNAGCSIDGVNNEDIVWPTGKAPAGTYVVRVDNYDNCQASAARFVVTVQKAGQAAQTFSGAFAATELGDAGGEGAGTTITQFTYP